MDLEFDASAVGVADVRRPGASVRAVALPGLAGFDRDARRLEVVEEAWLAVETGDATLTCSTDDLGTVSADRDRLLTVFENLFRNSVEHGSTGNRPQAGDRVEHGFADGSDDQAVTVRVGELEADGDSVGFFVEDDGRGIDLDARERVFETGYSTSSEGTGFGLDIVSTIATSHEWAVELTESASGGVRFEFSFDE